MELYMKNKKGQLEETDLYSVLVKSLELGGFEMDNLDDGCSCLVGIVQRTEKSKILVNIDINVDDRVSISEVNVYDTPIVKVEDDANMQRLI